MAVYRVWLRAVDQIMLKAVSTVLFNVVELFPRLEKA